MKKTIVFSVLFLLCLFIKPSLINANNYDYYPSGVNYLDPTNHELIDIDNNYFKYLTTNPFRVKEKMDYSFHLTTFPLTSLDELILNIYSVNGEVLVSPSYNSIIENDKIKSFHFYMPENAYKMGFEIYFSHNSIMQAEYDEIDMFLVLCEGLESPGVNANYPYAGPVPFEPVFSGFEGFYITSVDSPITAEEIKNSLVAFDETDGDVSSSIIIYEDNYTENIKTLGTYTLTFRANDYSLNYAFFVVNVKVSDLVPPNVLYTAVEANSYEALTLADIINYIEVSDNYDDISNVNIEVVEENYFDNYNIVGRYTIQLKLTDSSNNTSYEFIYIDVVDKLKPVIEGPLKHIKGNNYSITLEEFLEYYSCYDETDGDITNRLVVLEDNYSKNQFKVGLYEIKLSVKDSGGNEAILVVVVEVVDNLGPVFYIDRSKIIIDLIEVASLNSIIDFLRNNNVIEDANIINILVDEYSNNIGEEGSYKIVLNYNDFEHELEIELINRLDDEEKKENKKIANFFKMLWQLILNIIYYLFC